MDVKGRPPPSSSRTSAPKPAPVTPPAPLFTRELFTDHQHAAFCDALREKIPEGGILVAHIETAEGSETVSIHNTHGTQTTLPMDENTQSVIGSVTKWTTAALLFSLGIPLTQTLGKTFSREFLSELFSDPDRASKVTVAQLLSHRSGLQCNLGRDGAKFEFGRVGLSRMSITERFQYEQELMARGKPPKDKFEFSGAEGRFSYSNLGMCLLGLIVERRCPGKSFQEVRQDFFKSLGMHRTGIVPVDTNFLPTIDPMPFEDDPLYQPAGGLYSCVHDLSIFIKALRAIARGERTVGHLDATGLRTMMTPPPDGVPHAMGCRIDEGGRLVGHDGSRGHFIATLRADIFGDSGELSIGLCNECADGNPDVVSIVPVVKRWREFTDRT